RLDVELLRGLAQARPDWQIVLLGPVVKIDPASLPHAPNVHYLGMKKYEQLPDYMAGWDVALLLFARNEATRFISPTKTPEYLAAGKPVVSTSIHDVVEPYGEQALVHIADTPAQLVAVVEAILANKASRSDWLDRVDSFLSHMSWGEMWLSMCQLVEQAITERKAVSLTQAQAAGDTAHGA